MNLKRLTTAAKCLSVLFLIVFVPHWMDVFRSRDEGMYGLAAFQLTALLFCFFVTAIAQFFLHRASAKGNQQLHQLVNCALWWSAVSVMFFSDYAIVMILLGVFFAALAFFLWLEVAAIISESRKSSSIGPEHMAE